ncbi:MAG: YHS domain-containing protein [Candidatus Competibacteraceae bacterium]|nr:YHS domain-containing protein [Candidatus Competibacteraceae bacterium]
MSKAPVCGMSVAEDAPLRAEHGSETYRYCSEHCPHKFNVDPSLMSGQMRQRRPGHPEAPWNIPAPCTPTCASKGRVPARNAARPWSRPVRRWQSVPSMSVRCIQRWCRINRATAPSAAWCWSRTPWTLKRTTVSCGNEPPSVGQCPSGDSDISQRLGSGVLAAANGGNHRSQIAPMARNDPGGSGGGAGWLAFPCACHAVADHAQPQHVYPDRPWRLGDLGIQRGGSAAVGHLPCIGVQRHGCGTDLFRGRGGHHRPGATDSGAGVARS